MILSFLMFSILKFIEQRCYFFVKSTNGKSYTKAIADWTIIIKANNMATKAFNRNVVCYKFKNKTAVLLMLVRLCA